MSGNDHSQVNRQRTDQHVLQSWRNLKLLIICRHRLPSQISRTFSHTTLIHSQYSGWELGTASLLSGYSQQSGLSHLCWYRKWKNTADRTYCNLLLDNSAHGSKSKTCHKLGLFPKGLFTWVSGGPCSFFGHKKTARGFSKPIPLQGINVLVLEWGSGYESKLQNWYFLMPDMSNDRLPLQETFSQSLLSLPGSNCGISDGSVSLYSLNSTLWVTSIQ